MDFDELGFLFNSLTWTATYTEGLSIFLDTLQCILTRPQNVSDKRCSH